MKREQTIKGTEPMRDFERCQICGGWGWTLTHDCGDRYEIVWLDMEDAAYGDSAIDAVQKWAARIDAWNAMEVFEDGPVEVTCHGPDGIERTFEIERHAVPEYVASQISVGPVMEKGVINPF